MRHTVVLETHVHRRMSACTKKKQSLGRKGTEVLVPPQNRLDGWVLMVRGTCLPLVRMHS